MVEGTPAHGVCRDQAGDVATSGVRWRRALGRDLTWLMVVKLAALALLWWLFFSPAHHTPVDGAAAGRQLGVEPRAAGAGAARNIDEDAGR
jgi:hypothetical protein